MGLNERQRKAVETIAGPLLILAGAGSGKTTTMVQRIAYMIEQGIRPFNILGVTFTNKAVGEMKARVQKLVGVENSRDIWLRTFHSMCVKILKIDGEKAGVVAQNFSIYEPNASLSVMKKIQYDTKWSDINPTAIMQSISALKNEMVDVKTLLEYKPSNVHIDWEKAKKIIDELEHKEAVKALYPLYQENLQKQRAIDFDDMILKTIEMFLDNPSILEKYQNKFKYILVDEYQDTNHAQYILMKLLAEKYRNLAVCGDDFQSIYRFRGSDIRNILQFDRDYPDAHIVKLEQNYRSTNTIVTAANQIIKHNTNQKEKTLFTEVGQGDKICVYVEEDQSEEASTVAKVIIDEVRKKKKYKYKDFTILYRNNYQSARLEKTLNENKIPYSLIGSLTFFDRIEIKQLISYLQFFQNPNHVVAFEEIINVPRRKIGEKTIEKILDKVNTERSIIDILKDPHDISRMQKEAKKQALEFVALIEKYQAKINKMPLYKLLQELMHEIEYEKTFSGFDKEQREIKMDNISTFIQILRDADDEYPTLDDFLEYVSLQKDNEAVTDGNTVKLMTIHASKGLEYPCVIIYGLNEGIFPSPYAITPEDIEEERRLMYVAVTRAKQKLFMTYAKSKWKFIKDEWKMEVIASSRFLNEFEDDLCK